MKGTIIFTQANFLSFYIQYKMDRLIGWPIKLADYGPSNIIVRIVAFDGYSQNNQ